MPRFELPHARPAAMPVALVRKHYPFQHVYCTRDGESLYVNMEAVPSAQRGLCAQRRIVLLLDCSAGMAMAYERTIGAPAGELLPSPMERLIRGVVEALARDTERGIELVFLSHRVVYQTVAMDVGDVAGHVSAALRADGALGGAHAAQGFKRIWEDRRPTNMPTTVLFVTSGGIDANARWGQTLRRYYERVLHREAATRAQFYCFAVEVGPEAAGTLEEIDHLFPPRQGPEDLFEVQRAYDLESATAQLIQAGGMSSVGSDAPVTVSLSGDALLTMVNETLMPGRVQSRSAPLRKHMSFRVSARGGFAMRLSLPDHDDMLVQVEPSSLEVLVSPPEAPGKPPSLLSRLGPELIMQRGEKRSLGPAALRPLVAGFHWEAAACPERDVDASVLLLSARDKVEQEQDFVFFNQPIGASGAVRLLKEPPPPFDKAVWIEPMRVPASIERLLVVLSLHNQPGQRRTFQGFRGLTVTLLGAERREGLAHFPIEPGDETALIALALYRRGHEWRVQAVAEGFRDGLPALFRAYGDPSLHILE